MKKKKEKFIKQNFIGFIIGGIIFGTLGVYAAITFPSNEVSFDPSNSTLTSTNVKDAIDELYKKCTTSSAGDQIIEDNGLKKDPYECRYFFTGEYPNNYVSFNNELWRILSVECDGRIKIKKQVGINYKWDSTNSNNWARPATINTYLNETYYNSLTDIAKSQIVAGDFGIGAIEDDNNDLAKQINDENATKWHGYIALPTVSEYLRTSNNESNCGTIYLHNIDYFACRSTHWLFNASNWWTLSPVTDSSSDVYMITNTSIQPSYSDSGGGNYYTTYAYPTLYLSSEVQIKGGNGSQSNPYKISI